MSSLIKNILFSFFGNKFLQNILEKISFASEYFMGIGSGSTVGSSGEKIVFSLIKNRSPIIFDVGANKGQFAREALENSDGAVYSFEPSQKTFKMMQGSIDNNRHHAFNIGLGKEQSIMKLYYDNVASGLASLTKRDLDLMNIYFNKSEDVKIDTIDNFCQKNNISKINLLKIDVEGHELDVLKGATKMFNNVELVMFEFGGCNIDTKTYFKDFYKFFKNHNMVIYRITPSGYLHKIKYYNETYEQFRTTNFIASRDDDA